jgi:hypothetical protein
MMPHWWARPECVLCFQQSVCDQTQHASSVVLWSKEQADDQAVLDM